MASSSTTTQTYSPFQQELLNQLGQISTNVNTMIQVFVNLQSTLISNSTCNVSQSPQKNFSHNQSLSPTQSGSASQSPSRDHSLPSVQSVLSAPINNDVIDLSIANNVIIEENDNNNANNNNNHNINISVSNLSKQASKISQSNMNESKVNELKEEKKESKDKKEKKENGDDVEDEEVILSLDSSDTDDDDESNANQQNMNKRYKNKSSHSSSNLSTYNNHNNVNKYKYGHTSSSWKHRSKFGLNRSKSTSSPSASMSTLLRANHIRNHKYNGILKSKYKKKTTYDQKSDSVVNKHGHSNKHKNKHNPEHVFLSKSNRITINVGGSLYETTLNTVSADQSSMLSAMFSGRFNIEKDKNGSIFIDRDPTHFRQFRKYIHMFILFAYLRILSISHIIYI